MPSIHVQSPHTAHLPEKSRTPTTPSKAMLDIPHHRVRRKSVDTAFEEISKSFEFEKNNTPPDQQQSTDKKKDSGGLLAPSAIAAKIATKSPISFKRKMATKSDFNYL